ncbi:MAG: GNAT family N-acetyltransferase [Ignavibacteria bacterium]
MKILETERLTLRTIDESAVNLLIKYYLKNFNFLKPRIPVSDISFFTFDNMLERVLKETDLFEKGIQISFYIFKKKSTDNIIGNVTISNIIGGCFQSGFLGYQIDEDETGKGYAAEAVKSILNFSFLKTDLHRVEANVMTDNIASIRVLEKLNFVKEGFSRNYLNLNGKWEDHFRYALLNKS